MLFKNDIPLPVFPKLGGEWIGSQVLNPHSQRSLFLSTEYDWLGARIDKRCSANVTAIVDSVCLFSCLFKILARSS